MSKLPKAPLIEVIFEMRWQVDEDEAQTVQYLHGDLFQVLKGEYPYREAVNPHLPVDMLPHLPSYRFRVKEGGYPLVQIGAGILTVNTVDSTYFWEDYERRIVDVIEKLKQVHAFKTDRKVQFALQYIDLLKFDFENQDVLEFLEDKLNIRVSQSFFDERRANGVLVALNFPADVGLLSVNIGRGKDSKGNDGILVNSRILSENVVLENTYITSWLQRSHETCSKLFKEMTKGDLYESFKQKD